MKIKVFVAAIILCFICGCMPEYTDEEWQAIIEQKHEKMRAMHPDWPERIMSRVLEGGFCTGMTVEQVEMGLHLGNWFTDKRYFELQWSDASGYAVYDIDDAASYSLAVQDFMRNNGGYSYTWYFQDGRLVDWMKRPVW